MLLIYFSDDAIGVGKKLFPLFALALDLKEDFFADKVVSMFSYCKHIADASMFRTQTKESAAIMRVIHYPPQTGPHDDRVVGIGAHTE